MDYCSKLNFKFGEFLGVGRDFFSALHVSENFQFAFLTVDKMEMNNFSD